MQTISSRMLAFEPLLSVTPEHGEVPGGNSLSEGEWQFGKQGSRSSPAGAMVESLAKSLCDCGNGLPLQDCPFHRPVRNNP